MTQVAQITAQQQKILAVLEKSAQPQSAYDILSKLHSTNIKHPPTVYRALEKLQQLGLIHRLESLNAYVACHHDHDGRHAADHSSQFAICTSCGNVQELPGKSLSQVVKQAQESFLSRVEKKVLELSRICRTCDSQDK